MRSVRRVLLAFALSVAVYGQTLVDVVRFPRFDLLFKDPPAKNGIGCDATPLRPHLNFGFRFISGYVGHLPLKLYSGEGQRFIVLTRVTPDDADKKPAIFSQFFRMPKLPPKSGTQLEIDGAFFVGEGGYRVEWLIVDREGHRCAKNWHIEAKLASNDRGLVVAMPAGTVAPVAYEPWKGVPSGQQGTHLTVLLHVAPLSMRRLKMHPYDQAMLLSSLLSLLERTPVAKVKLVAFNLDQQKEIFRQDDFDQEGWGRLIDAIAGLDLVTVPVSVLQKQGGHRDIVRSLVQEQLEAEEQPDAVIFLGPTSRQMDKLKLETAATPHPRFYYLQYKAYWARGSEFADIITHVVRSLSGKVFVIYTPHDLSVALQRMNRTGE